MKILFFIIVTIIVLMLLVSCSRDSSTNPVNPPSMSYIGWVVGVNQDGYGIILYTSDGGNHWIRQGDTSMIPDVSLQAVVAVDSLNVWAVGGSDQGYGTIINSSDGGNSWNRMGAGVIPDIELSGLDVYQNFIWAVGAQGTIVSSSDNGLTWENFTDTSFANYDLSGVSVIDDQNIWICGGSFSYGLILRSTDGGQNWVQQGDTSSLINYTLITIDAFNSDIAWVVGHANSIYFTSDGGSTWIDKSPGGGHGLWDANGVCVLDQDRAWVVMDYDMIYYTNDQGQNWGQQNSPSSGYYLLRIMAIDNNHAWITGSEFNSPFGGIIMNTTNGGHSWNIQNHPTDTSLWSISFVK